MMNSKHLFVLEGNIGAGKSTMLRIIEEEIPELFIVPEPTDKWQRIGEHDENLLGLFYQDTQRWAYTFQSYAFMSRVQSIVRAQQQQPQGSIALLERSVYCDRYCFAKNCYESGLMTALEWEMYKELFAWLVGGHVALPSGFIYLQASAKTCYQRAGIRARSEEAALPLSYFQSLHDKHEDWLVHGYEVGLDLQQVPLLVLDCDQDFSLDNVQKSRHIEAIMNFINDTVTRSTAPFQTGSVPSSITMRQDT